MAIKSNFRMIVFVSIVSTIGAYDNKHAKALRNEENQNGGTVL